MARVRRPSGDRVEEAGELAEEYIAVTVADHALLVGGGELSERVGAHTESAVLDIFEVLGLNDVAVDEIEHHPVDDDVAELFDPIAGERGAIVLDGVVEAGGGIETGGFDEAVEFAGNEGVAEVEQRIHRVGGSALLASFERDR